MIIIWIVFALYCEVLLVVGADLYSGIMKAKRNGVMRSSYGFRRTVEKLSRYFNVLIVLTVVDAMQMTAVWYHDEFYSISLPFFPFLTLLGAIGLSLIEFRSIYEKAEDKVRFDEVGALAGKVLKNKDDIEAMAKAVGEYIKSNSGEKTTVKITTETKPEKTE